MSTSLLYSPEQEEFRRSFGKFLADHAPEQKLREWMASGSGFDPSLWHRIAELGLPGLLIPEQYGGSGAGPGELAAVFEEAGKCLFATPLLASGVLAAETLVALNDDAARSEFLPAIAAGSLVATVADKHLKEQVDQPTVTASRRSGQWYLDGTVRHVLDGQNADLVLVPIHTRRGVSIFALDPVQTSVLVCPLETLDQTRKQADIELNECPVRLLGEENQALAAAERAHAFAAVAVAAEALGGSERALELAVEHATQRIQFGRVIGSFQAIKHKCADMKLLLEASRAAVHKAVGSVDATKGPWIDVSIAKVYTCDAFFRIAAENLQIHGGMGCTWEHPAHLYLRRAKSLQQLLGTSTYHRSSIARHLRLVE